MDERGGRREEGDKREGAMDGKVMEAEKERVEGE